MKQQKSAGLVLYYLKDSVPFFLMLKYPSYWGFTKGLLEENEDEKSAALREAEEEAGIKHIEIIPGFEEHQEFFFKLNGELIKKNAVFFLAKTSEAEAKKTKISWEHKDFLWLTLEDAVKLTKVKPNKILLKKAYDFIIENEKQKKLF